LIDATKLILLVFENSIVCIMDLNTGDIKWQYRVRFLVKNKNSNKIVE